MGLFQSLLERLRRGFGSTPSAPTEPTASYRCSICGTGVDGPDAICPLCGSSDIVSADETSSSSSGLSGRPARERSVADDTGTAASMLARTDLLARYEDRWKRVEGGYRVSLPDGDRTVPSQDEVRALLFRHLVDESGD